MPQLRQAQSRFPGKPADGGWGFDGLCRGPACRWQKLHAIMPDIRAPGFCRICERRVGKLWELRLREMRLDADCFRSGREAHAADLSSPVEARGFAGWDNEAYAANGRAPCIGVTKIHCGRGSTLTISRSGRSQPPRSSNGQTWPQRCARRHCC